MIFVFLTLVDIILYGARTFLGYVIVNIFELLIFFMGVYVAKKSRGTSVSDSVYNFATSRIFLFFSIFLIFLILIKILWTEGVWYGLQ